MIVPTAIQPIWTNDGHVGQFWSYVRVADYIDKWTTSGGRRSIRNPVNEH